MVLPEAPVLLGPAGTLVTPALLGLGDLSGGILAALAKWFGFQDVGFVETLSSSLQVQHGSLVDLPVWVYLAAC